MSLINEALKKAQNLQARSPSGAAPASTPAAAPKLKTKASQVVPPPFVPTVTTTATTSTPRRPVGGSKTVLVLGGILCVVAVCAIGFAMFVLFGKSQTNTVVSDSQNDPAAVSTTAPAAAPHEETPAAGTEESSVAENAAAPAVTATNTPTTPAPATAAAAPAPAPAEVAPPPPPPKRVNKPVARIQEFVNKITVSGIRMGERSRALMNDRVYAIGDLVNSEMELHLTVIEERELTFEDAEGNTYNLHF